MDSLGAFLVDKVIAIIVFMSKFMFQQSYCAGRYLVLKLG